MSRIQQANCAVEMVREQVRERKDSTAFRLRREADTLKKTLKLLTEKFVLTQDGQGIFRGDNQALPQLSSVLSSLSSSWDAPTETQLTYLKYAESKLEKALAEFNCVFEIDVRKFQELVEAAKVTFFTLKEPLDMNWKPKSATD
ncbi:MAG: hypothetical protein ACK42Y_08760 [Candidatus Thermochlorobacter sp.]